MFLLDVVVVYLERRLLGGGTGYPSQSTSSILGGFNSSLVLNSHELGAARLKREMAPGGAAVVSKLKLVSMIALVAIVLYGAVMRDSRYTMLLLPPFLFNWFSEHSAADFASIPVIRFLSLPLRTVGITDVRAQLAFAGMACGLLLNLMYV